MEGQNGMLEKAFKHYRSVLTIISLTSCLIFIVIATLLTGSVSKAIILSIIVLCGNVLVLVGLLIPMIGFVRHYNEMMEYMEAGDLSLLDKIKAYETNKLFRKLTQSIARVLEGLDAVVKGACETIDTISKSTTTINQDSDEAIKAIEEIGKMMGQIAEGATMQAAQSQTGEALMEGLAVEITAAYDNCHHIKEEAKHMTQLNQDGRESIHTLQVRAESADQAKQEISDSIQLLMDNMKDITSFVDTIQSISSQTNLLALNAAIEAARAGDAGRGFGVVAEEIRTLADQSHASTSEIKSLVERIHAETNSVQEAMTKMQAVSSEEVKAVEAAEGAFKKIDKSIEQINEKIDVTFDAVNKVNKNKEEVKQVIEKVASVTQQTATRTEENANFTKEQVKRMENVKDEIAQLCQIVARLDGQLKKYRRVKSK